MTSRSDYAPYYGHSVKDVLYGEPYPVSTSQLLISLRHCYLENKRLLAEISKNAMSLEIVVTDGFRPGTDNSKGFRPNQQN